MTFLISVLFVALNILGGKLLEKAFGADPLAGIMITTIILFIFAMLIYNAGYAEATKQSEKKGN